MNDNENDDSNLSTVGQEERNKKENPIKRENPFSKQEDDNEEDDEYY